MKKILTFSTLVVALSVLASSGWAESNKKIAVLDAPSVINRTKAAEDAKEMLRTQTTEAQSKIDEMEKELTKMKEDLEKKRAVMSEETYTEANLKLTQKVREFRNRAQSIQEDLDRQNVLLKKEITDYLADVVKEISKEEGYDVVIAKHLLIFADDSIDISDEVLKRLDKRMTKGKGSKK